jgi:hypothetical protein
MSKREKPDLGRPPRYAGAAEQSAGVSSAPDTARGALANLGSGKRFWCAECEQLRAVVKVDNEIVQTPNAAIYATTLECGHDRQIVMNVRRPQPKVEAPTEEMEAA